MGVRKSETQIIDRKAVRIFEDLYDDEWWTSLSFVPDVVGIDRRVDLVEDGKHIGLACYVQIKGKKKFPPKKKKSDFISQKIEVEHLEYYSRLAVPVFLFVIGIS